MSAIPRRILLRVREKAVQRAAPSSAMNGYPPEAERRRVAAEQDHPRLRIWRSPMFDWWWELTGPHGERLDNGATETWAEALAVGLAALEVASLEGPRP